MWTSAFKNTHNKHGKYLILNAPDLRLKNFNDPSFTRNYANWEYLWLSLGSAVLLVVVGPGGPTTTNSTATTTFQR
jgi:hypothetical protein